MIGYPANAKLFVVPCLSCPLRRRLGSLGLLLVPPTRVSPRSDDGVVQSPPHIPCKHFEAWIVISTNIVLQVGVLFLQTLNHFQRYAFVRQAHARQLQI